MEVDYNKDKCEQTGISLSKVVSSSNFCSDVFDDIIDMNSKIQSPKVLLEITANSYFSSALTLTATNSPCRVF